MKSKLYSGIAIPALIAFSTAAALAQDPPAQPPAENMPGPSETAPSPAPLPDTAAPMDADKSVAPPETTVDKSAEAKSPGSFAVQQAADEWRSSKIVGLNVYNDKSEKIGDINDLILASDGKVGSAVLGVGGFLGMGEKLVAVPFSELKFSSDENGNARVTLSTTKEALQSAPDFKYADKRS
jgi:sporulation protein YlmC with PRC-barrel domain